MLPRSVADQTTWPAVLGVSQVQPLIGTRWSNSSVRPSPPIRKIDHRPDSGSLFSASSR